MGVALAHGDRRVVHGAVVRDAAQLARALGDRVLVRAHLVERQGVEAHRARRAVRRARQGRSLTRGDLARGERPLVQVERELPGHEVAALERLAGTQLRLDGLRRVSIRERDTVCSLDLKVGRRLNRVRRRRSQRAVAVVDDAHAHGVRQRTVRDGLVRAGHRNLLGHAIRVRAGSLVCDLPKRECSAVVAHDFGGRAVNSRRALGHRDVGRDQLRAVGQRAGERRQLERERAGHGRERRAVVAVVDLLRAAELKRATSRIAIGKHRQVRLVGCRGRAIVGHGSAQRAIVVVRHNNLGMVDGAIVRDTAQLTRLLNNRVLVLAHLVERQGTEAHGTRRAVRGHGDGLDLTRRYLVGRKIALVERKRKLAVPEVATAQRLRRAELGIRRRRLISVREAEERHAGGGLRIGRDRQATLAVVAHRDLDSLLGTVIGHAVLRKAAVRPDGVISLGVCHAAGVHRVVRHNLVHGVRKRPGHLVAQVCLVIRDRAEVDGAVPAAHNRLRAVLGAIGHRGAVKSAQRERELPGQVGERRARAIVRLQHLRAREAHQGRPVVRVRVRERQRRRSRADGLVALGRADAERAVTVVDDRHGDALRERGGHVGGQAVSLLRDIVLQRPRGLVRRGDPGRKAGFDRSLQAGQIVGDLAKRERLGIRARIRLHGARRNDRLGVALVVGVRYDERELVALLPRAAGDGLGARQRQRARSSVGVGERRRLRRAIIVGHGRLKSARMVVRNAHVRMVNSVVIRNAAQVALTLDNRVVVLALGLVSLSREAHRTACVVRSGGDGLVLARRYLLGRKLALVEVERELALSKVAARKRLRSPEHRTRRRGLVRVGKREQLHVARNLGVGLGGQAALAVVAHRDLDSPAGLGVVSDAVLAVGRAILSHRVRERLGHRVAEVGFLVGDGAKVHRALLVIGDGLCAVLRALWHGRAVGAAQRERELPGEVSDGGGAHVGREALRAVQAHGSRALIGVRVGEAHARRVVAVVRRHRKRAVTVVRNGHRDGLGRGGGHAPRQALRTLGNRVGVRVRTVLVGNRQAVFGISLHAGKRVVDLRERDGHGIRAGSRTRSARSDNGAGIALGIGHLESELVALLPRTAGDGLGARQRQRAGGLVGVGKRNRQFRAAVVANGRHFELVIFGLPHGHTHVMHGGVVRDTGLRAARALLDNRVVVAADLAELGRREGGVTVPVVLSGRKRFMRATRRNVIRAQFALVQVERELVSGQVTPVKRLIDVERCRHGRRLVDVGERDGVRSLVANRVSGRGGQLALDVGHGDRDVVGHGAVGDVRVGASHLGDGVVVRALLGVGHLAEGKGRAVVGHGLAAVLGALGHRRLHAGSVFARRQRKREAALTRL